MLDRIDIHPTRTYAVGDVTYKLRPGKPIPFGATLVPGGVNPAAQWGIRRALGVVLIIAGLKLIGVY